MTSCSSTACQAPTRETLTDLVAGKVASHPCYSRSGHHRFARMHLPVAPACNLQCNYCNRKFDCSNESRPGVSSTLLTPEQAVAKVRQVATAIPQLSVVGIAGPGDPLANIHRTFSTLVQVREAFPDLKLCLSTNGLMLPDAADRLVALGVDHVTVTINTLDPDIAAQIYAWLWLDGERYSGREAGEILIARQLEGVRRLTSQGVLVKINSVLIPGINEHALPDVSQLLQTSGAFIHNIMPLIARPEHGTVFGLNGQPEPDAAMVAAVRQRCGEIIPQMTHCHQCRADAIGMLGEDRSQQFAAIPEPESASQPWLPVLFQRAKLHASIATRGESDEEEACLVAVASQRGDVIDNHFGHAERFYIYSLSAAGVVLVNQRFTPKYCHGSDSCEPEPDSEARMAAIFDLLADVKAVFCVRMGYTPWQKLEARGIQPCVDDAWQPVTEALDRWWQDYRARTTSLSLRNKGVA
ncbi:nitrogenase cofactor biosynthesis protein NifB [Pantoea sp. At-9b]|uniref:nitrogenase cofactor biosynthesis protein NifB n=1 Tax=Pantoea sp. (strain At-9b) TaxID=592316 RepID=UPI0001B4021A|nr:nitrogenase cofactor biosynthesis protein NifB [Pantoea sp. At-9b]ACU32737.1 nitrogenase cofactor biosynthesis protein [Pantoea sp. At-9b]ADU72672.1 nitrogenase cofactor biosynthesis protein NifB [Pantoea sp. At-9b]